MRAEIIALPIFTLKDPDDAYGVNDIDYIPRRDVLAIIDAALASRAAPPAVTVGDDVWGRVRAVLYDTDWTDGHHDGDALCDAVKRALGGSN